MAILTATGKESRSQRSGSTGRLTAGVLVVGGTIVQVDAQRVVRTRTPFRNYLHELARCLGRVEWIAPEHRGRPFMEGVLERDVAVVSYRNESMWSCLRASTRMVRMLARRPDVIWFLPNKLLPVFFLARGLAPRMLVYLAGDFRLTLAAESPRRGWVWTRLFALSFVVPLKFADVVVARGRELAQLAGRYNSSVVETVPIIDLANGAGDGGSRQRDASTVLFVGKLLEAKGVGELLHAWATIRDELTREHPELHLELVGDGRDRAILEALSGRLDLADSVAWRGYIDDPAELDRAFHRAVVVVVPTTTYPEGVPRVIEEACARGIPVIAARLRGIAAEFEAGEVLLVTPGAVDELADAILSMVRDGELRERFRAGAERRQAKLRAGGTAAAQHAGLLRRLGGERELPGVSER